MNTKAVGIDLGTTYSAAAWIDPSGRTAMVRNAEGELLTPSVVLFGDSEVAVGKEARSATTIHPDQVAEWVKRDMGAAVYSRPIRGSYLPPEVIQSCILRKLHADLVEALGRDLGVVITVPAYFDEPRRKATADAGEMAGLDVLDIVNEPTAAALAFGEVLGYLSPAGGAREEMTVLVYDLGGGTFDATLLRLRPGEIRTLATDGDVQLGGYDWDMRLVDHVAESFKQAHGVDPRQDPAALKRLYNGVVDAKHALSARSRTTIRVDHAGYSSQFPVTREEFEELTADLLERTAYTTRQLLTTAKLGWSRISRLLLVGGSTRMPMVSRMLRQLSGMEPDHTVHPDEAVARGAAVYADYLLADRAAEGPGPGFQVVNVNSHSLGVEGIDPQTFRKVNVVLIPRNTPLPATFTEKFVTKTAGQQSIVVQVLEGESSIPGECTPIGRTVIRDLPDGLPQGWPVEVTFEYATNGRLSVRAVVPGTHREVRLEIEREVGLSSEGISRWTKPVSASSGFDAFEEMVADLIGGGELVAQSPTSAPGREETGGGESDLELPDPGPSAGAPTRAPPSPPRPQGPEPAQASPIPFEPVPEDAAEPEPRAAIRRAPAPDMTGQRADAGLRAPRVDADQPAGPEPKPVPRWLITFIGFVISAIVGLSLGYVIVKWLLPDSGILHLW